MDKGRAFHIPGERRNEAKTWKLRHMYMLIGQ